MKSVYEVMVGNVGTVITTTSMVRARTAYDKYVDLSRTHTGRASGEEVVLMRNGEPIAEHMGDSYDNDPSPRRSNNRPVLPVIFRAEKSGDHKGEVTAVFPTLPWTGPRDFTVYAHLGQHGAGTLGWYQQRTRAAKPAEYSSLLRELRQIYEQGPDKVQLKVYSRFTREMDDERRQQSNR